MARLIVTLPPGLLGEAANAFARDAARQGADRLELRTDLHRGGLDASDLARELPLLISERGEAAPEAWLTAAAEVDRPLGSAQTAEILSLHAPRPLAPAQALALWSSRPLPKGAQLKHVEPLGPLPEAWRLRETQERLGARFGSERVTVLATGPLALPFRCLLAQVNALDYLALTGEWAAARGQRLLADAVRERRSGQGGARFGLLGSGIGHSRSPRVHRQPFDRLDLPADTELSALLAALHPWYAGFAVTSPFKRAAASLAGASLPAVNTLMRTEGGWRSANTDVQGAAAALDRLGSAPLTILGGGGASVALGEACRVRGQAASIRRRAESFAAPLTGAVAWTWPPQLPPPPGLRFAGARVGVIAYGPQGRAVAAQIRERGGAPIGLGARWFVAQARAQRSLWETAA